MSCNPQHPLACLPVNSRFTSCASSGGGTRSSRACMQIAGASQIGWKAGMGYIERLWRRAC